MALPHFRYHPDPLMSGSVVASSEACLRCGESRGYLYAGPTYADVDLEDQLCPWCIADGSAHAEFDVDFVDSDAFAEGTPDGAIEEITQRTPGYFAWQTEVWPSCCGDATAFLAPVGSLELQGPFRAYEGAVLNHVIYDMGISGTAATRLVESLRRESGPTAYLFRCLHCEGQHVHVDHT
jgi:uncharacterized protein